jgi:hypothetical protein
MSFNAKLFYRSIRFLAACLPQSLLALLLWPYYKAAIFFVIRSLKRVDSVIAICLAGSAAEGRISYGISDLDFLILIRSTNTEEASRQQLQTQFANLRRFFWQLQPIQELAIFNEDQIEHIIKPYLPHMLSIPSRLRILWEGADHKLKFTYSRDHEMALLSAIWRKLLLAQKEDQISSRYAEHIRRRVEETLNSVEGRLELEKINTDILTRIQRAVRAVDSLSFDLHSLDNDSVEFSVQYIPEFLKQDLIKPRVAQPITIKCIKSPLASLDRSIHADFCFDRGALYPLKAEYSFILTYKNNPFVFNQLSHITSDKRS